MIFEPITPPHDIWVNTANNRRLIDKSIDRWLNNAKRFLGKNRAAEGFGDRPGGVYAESMLLGEVDRVDDHYIATKFLGLLIPVSSMYVTSSSSSRRGNVSTLSWEGVPVRFNVKSALLAYPRVWLWFLAAAWPFLTHYGENVNDVPASTYWTMGGMVATALFFAFVPGRLSAREKARLRVLGRVTGLKLDPSKLVGWTRVAKLDFLRDQLEKAGVASSPEAVLAAAQGAPAEVLDVLYTFACYSGDGRDWRDTAARILELRARAG
jgi:hypothetical protein